MYVFAYGSLMWNPGFAPTKAHPALLNGWNRAWNVKSTFYRGCPDRPGYVLGLREGGSCVGIVLKVPDKEGQAVIERLTRRENREAGYETRTLPVISSRGAIEALVFTTPRLAPPCLDTLKGAYACSSGYAGPNRDYIDRTRAFLRDLAIPHGWPEPEDGLPEGLFDVNPLTSD